MKIEFFSIHFQKILKYQIYWQSIQWELSCSMQTYGWTGGQTHMKNQIVAFCNFVNVS